MTQPIRPHDASGIYRRQVTSAEVSGDGQTRRIDGGASGASRRTDRVTVSEGAREFARIMDAVQQSPDVRSERVQALRDRIEGGSYVVDYNGLAALLADRGLSS